MHNDHSRRNGCIATIIVLGVLVLISRLFMHTSQPTGGTSAPPLDCSQTAMEQHLSSLSDGAVLKSDAGRAEGNPTGVGSVELGSIAIDNGTENDAVVELVDSSTQAIVFEVYIAAQSHYTISVVSGYTYNLLFALGEDWDNKGMQFQACQSYEKFDDGFPFSSPTTEIDSYQVSLNPVSGGNASTSTIDASEFTNP